MKPSRYQKWPDLEGVYTGTWIIPMVVTKDIPRFFLCGQVPCESVVSRPACYM